MMKLFISYAHTDKWQVQQIADIVKASGHDPWFDTRLIPGQDWQSEIETNIKASDVFLYVLSPESVKSEWCQWEFARSVELEKPVLPILIQTNTDIPEAITKHQYLDLSQGLTPESTAKLMGGLMQLTISVPKADVPDVQVPTESKPARAELPQKHVFISYSRHDTQMMTQIRDRLKGENIPVWTDESIKTGAPHWQTVIEKAIENAGCILVILSPEAKNSEWVRREITYAQALNIQIIAALIRGDESNAVPFGILGGQHADLQRNYAGGMQEIISTVREYTLKDTPQEVPSAPVLVKQKFGESFWDTLIRVINKNRCTPFIGSGLDRGILSSREEIARAWASKHDYPFAPGYERDLARVGHFVTIDMGGPFWSKDEIVETWLRNVDLVSTETKNPAYSILASMDFPVYVTTNYHDLLYSELVKQGKDPQRIFWLDTKWQSSRGKLENEFSVEKPLVFHIYGHQSEPESIILTEDDYLNFLVRTAKNEIQFPTMITDVIGKSSYLFVGFTVTDWNLRILFHVLSNHGRTGRGPHIAVQIEPVRDMSSSENENRVKKYLESYFRDYIGTFADVYIGDSIEFIRDLKDRWEKEPRND